MGRTMCLGSSLDARGDSEEDERSTEVLEGQLPCSPPVNLPRDSRRSPAAFWTSSGVCRKEGAQVAEGLSCPVCRREGPRKPFLLH